MRRKIIDWWLARHDLTVTSIRGPLFQAAMNRLRARQLNIGSVLDVGASTGCWSEKALPYFPEAKYLCVEAQSGHEPALKEFVRRNPNANYVIAAAGPREGEIFFDSGDPFGGVASDKPGGPGWKRGPVATLDRLVTEHHLPAPYLIKLDTHGFEVPILDGARSILNQTAAVILEVYNFRLQEGALTFPQTCDDMARRGFRCFDLFEPVNRPGDGALWQMDLVFLKADRPEFRLGSYQ